MVENGPRFEPDVTDLPDKAVYCVLCGTIYLWTNRRSCPTCTAYKEIEELRKELASVKGQ